jgi:hypothetical protein
MVKSRPPDDVDAKVRLTDIQFSEIARAIVWSLSGNKDELRMEEQIPTMWNYGHLIMPEFKTCVCKMTGLKCKRLN